MLWYQCHVVLEAQEVTGAVAVWRVTYFAVRVIRKGLGQFLRTAGA